MAENRFAAVAARSTTVVEGTPPVPVREFKYTVKLTAEVRARIDEDVRRLSDQTGLLVDRRHVVLALFAALHSDESLFADVKRRVVTMFEDKTA